MSWEKHTGLSINTITTKYTIPKDIGITFPVQLRVLGNVDAISSMKFSGSSITPSEYVTINSAGTYSATLVVKTDVTSYENMFKDCVFSHNGEVVGGLIEVGIGTLQKVSKVTSFAGMFDGCAKLETIAGLSRLCVNAATDISRMFRGCGGADLDFISE